VSRFSLDTSLEIPRPRDEVFAFFADAANLERITPPWIGFTILTPEVPMTVGARIDYRLRIHGVPLRWSSEITRWEPPHRFVDEQRRGPYRSWVHEHRFTAHGDATLVEDRVLYDVFGGAWIERLFVRRDVRRIFEFRREALLRIFAPDPRHGRAA